MVRVLVYSRHLSLFCFQFNSYDPKDGQITEWDFADMLLTYSSFHEKKKQKILRKVKKYFKENSQVRPVQK